MPFAIKRIQSVRGAERAVEVGCDGIVVANHAGRQVDGAVASLDVLESIVEAGWGRRLPSCLIWGLGGRAM
jgi:isopentenyl diphosphate isomerase/L-lactate dehydrogenase-like FMN-dependent dehydrogenase